MKTPLTVEWLEEKGFVFDIDDETGLVYGMSLDYGMDGRFYRDLFVLFLDWSVHLVAAPCDPESEIEEQYVCVATPGTRELIEELLRHPGKPSIYSDDEDLP